MKDDLDICVICGRTDEQNNLTFEDEQKGLTQSDIEIGFCQKCGQCVCGFCADLQVCH